MLGTARVGAGDDLRIGREPRVVLDAEGAALSRHDLVGEMTVGGARAGSLLPRIDVVEGFRDHPHTAGACVTLLIHNGRSPPRTNRVKQVRP